MKCPHCRVDFHDKPDNTFIGKDKNGFWGLTKVTCSACHRYVMFLAHGNVPIVDNYQRPSGIKSVDKTTMFYPKGSSRGPVPAEVPADIAEDYAEASLVLADSPKASAALSRRCLQNVLRSTAKVKPGNLAGEIQQVLDSGRLPSHLAESIDAVRNIGNFSTHPIKSESSGEIVPVEPHEAEWNLDVLDALFDFYFAQPAILKAKRAALDAKLAAAGKPPLK